MTENPDFCPPKPEAEGKTSRAKIPTLRLTAQQIRERWLNRCFKAVGYLESLLAALKKPGWSIVIHNIGEFCREWGLHKRTFQRAKRFLIEAGKLIEKRLNRDSIELKLIVQDDTLDGQDDKSDAHRDKVDGQDDKSDAHRDRSDAIAPSKPLPHEDSETSPDLLQSSFTSSSKALSPTHPPERERTENVEEEDLIAFVIRQVQGARNPRAYAKKVLSDDRPFWENQFHLSRQRLQAIQQLQQIPSPALSPSTLVPIGPIARSPEELANLKAAIERGRAAARGRMIS